MKGKQRQTEEKKRIGENGNKLHDVIEEERRKESE
jgi:hypothetical protein